MKFPAGLMHATALVRGGNLIEATREIQRALQGGDAARQPSDARFTTATYANGAGTRATGG